MERLILFKKLEHYFGQIVCVQLGQRKFIKKLFNGRGFKQLFSNSCIIIISNQTNQWTWCFFLLPLNTYCQFLEL